MENKNIELLLLLDSLISPICNWLILPVGIIWFSYLYSSDILMIIISTIVCFIVFNICCYFANFIISILYLMIMPIAFIFRKVKAIIIFLHIIFFTTWALLAYDFAVNFEPNYIRPLSLILYSAITLPFIYYAQRNIDNLNTIESIYITILKIATFISCIALLLFKIDIYTFGIIFIIPYLFWFPLIKKIMDSNVI